MPDCIWDDLVDNEAVVRSLFPSSPSSDRFKYSDPPLSLEDRLEDQDINPTPLKRRRLLESNEDILMDITACLPDPQEASNEFLMEMCEGLSSVNPSPNSSWYMNIEESLSSVENVIEQSSGSIEVSCINNNDASGIHYARTSNFMAEKKEGHNRHSTHSVASDGCNMQRQHLSQSKLIRSSENKKLPQRILLKSAHSKESVSLQSSKECSRQRECPLSVLAYPFALVKPIGIHGDITLQDINQRINSSPCRTSQAYSEQPKSISSSPYSGKSVLALTKIYTEGNGTITIMRTKG
ncbi:hypothetical protein KP509_39G003700 [Ceratopteris richardii]|nr:hypothetical protein KP509_39G003700 [Ceratopteris richardii]